MVFLLFFLRFSFGFSVNSARTELLSAWEDFFPNDVSDLNVKNTSDRVDNSYYGINWQVIDSAFYNLQHQIYMGGAINFYITTTSNTIKFLIENCFFYQNMGSTGGAINVYLGGSAPSYLVISKCCIYNCAAYTSMSVIPAQGQAIYSTMTTSEETNQTITYTSIVDCGKLFNQASGQSTIQGDNTIFEYNYLNMSNCYAPTQYSAFCIQMQSFYISCKFSLRYSQLESLSSGVMALIIGNPFMTRELTTFEHCNIVNNSHVNPSYALFTFWSDLDLIGCYIFDNQANIILSTSGYNVGIYNCTFNATELIVRMSAVYFKTPQYTNTFVNQLDFFATALCQYSHLTYFMYTTPPVTPESTLPLQTPNPTISPPPTRTLYPTSLPRQTSLFNEENSNSGSNSLSTSSVFAIGLAAACAFVVICVGIFCLITSKRSNDSFSEESSTTSTYISSDRSTNTISDSDI